MGPTFIQVTRTISSRKYPLRGISGGIFVGKLFLVNNF